jgi:CP family cyanate transporter-like MFS transporter
MPHLPFRTKIITLCILWFAGVYLRLPMLVMPPLSPAIGAELSLNLTQIGALTTIPVLMLSLGSLPGSLVISRLGPLMALVLSLLLVGLASAARGWVPPLASMYFFTATLGLAVAVMQPAFPALVLHWCPGFVALGSAVYMNGMLVGEFIGSGLTLPMVMPWLQDNWRLTLLFWSFPALPAAALVYFGHRFGLPKVGRSAIRLDWRPRWKEPRVWHLGIVLSAGSGGFFGTNAYMNALAANAGGNDPLAGFLMVFNGMQVVGSVSMVFLARFLIGKRWPVLANAWSIFIGLVGLSLSSGWLLMTFLVILGLSTCLQLILLVALVPEVANSKEAAPLAAGMFTIGYLLGFAVPLLCGFLADVTGNTHLTLVPLMVLALAASLLAQNSRYLGSE